MEDTTRRLIETFDKDFHDLASKNGWTSEDLEKMKNLQKLMYYLEVRCAMKEGGDYPGSEYMEEDSRSSYGGYNSYANGNRGGMSRGRMNGNRSYTGGSSGHYPYGMSGRRYYDSERDKFMGDLHKMMGNESDPETREAMERVAQLLEMR